jgi:hypothetical protein
MSLEFLGLLTVAFETIRQKLIQDASNLEVLLSSSVECISTTKL